MGIAAALLDAAERTARDGGATKVGLRVLGSDEGAIQLYERHGYAVEGRYTGEFLIDGRYVNDLTLRKAALTVGAAAPHFLRHPVRVVLLLSLLGDGSYSPRSSASDTSFSG